MKHFILIFTISIGLISCSGQRQKNVDYGYITSNWVYKNDGLNLEYAIPKDWYFLNSSTKSFVKVGSDIKNMESYTSSFQVPIQEFKTNNSDQIATLIEIAKLDSSAAFVNKIFDYHADKTITLGLVYSDNVDAYSFLRKTCLKCTDDNFKDIYLKDVKLGNTNFVGYITGVIDNGGNKLGHFFGVKGIGSLYLVCQYNFPDLKSFEAYKDYFRRLTIK